MTARDIVILGSTGSIGTQALDLVRANPDRFRVVGLTAGLWPAVKAARQWRFVPGPRMGAATMVAVFPTIGTAGVAVAALGLALGPGFPARNRVVVVIFASYPLDATVLLSGANFGCGSTRRPNISPCCTTAS